jgi:hypothetical protein
MKLLIALSNYKLIYSRKYYKQLMNQPKVQAENAITKDRTQQFG